MKLNRSIRYALYLIVLICISPARADDLVSLFRAINNDNASGVSALLARGVDPNAVDPRGQVALYVALREGSPKVVAVLAAHPGIQLDATNAANETPLMMAALRGDVSSTQLLLDRGAAVNRSGWTPLHYAASSPETKVVALLLDRGAQLEAESPNRTTPLMMAARYGTEDAALLLLARGASAKARNDVNLNAADFARLAGRTKLAARLDEAAR
jgi:ankyrin repeat protein